MSVVDLGLQVQVVEDFGDCIQDMFFTKVVGVKHNNDGGGSRRSTIVGRCIAGESLHLIPEPTNPHHDKAVRVIRDDGSQLGYLGWRQAEQVVRTRKGFWICYFVHPNLHPETKKTVGAVVLLVHLLVEDAEAQRAKKNSAEGRAQRMDEIQASKAERQLLAEVSGNEAARPEQTSVLEPTAALPESAPSFASAARRETPLWLRFVKAIFPQ